MWLRLFLTFRETATSETRMCSCGRAECLGRELRTGRSRVWMTSGSFAQIPGGIIEDSCVLRGVMINKDVTHPRMRRYIKNPRIVLLDSSLEYKKGESQVRLPACLLAAAGGLGLPTGTRK